MNFWGYQTYQKTVHEIDTFYFQLKSKWEGRNNELLKAISSEISQKNSQQKKNKLNTAFDYGFILNVKDQEDWIGDIA